MLQVNVIDHDRQGSPELSLEERLRAWRNARLPAVIRQKPAPQPEAVDLFDVRRWQRNSRRLDAQRFMRRCTCEQTADLAVVIGVSGQTIRNWRCGRYAPTPRHWRQLRVLESLFEQVRAVALATQD